MMFPRKGYLSSLVITEDVLKAMLFKTSPLDRSNTRFVGNEVAGRHSYNDH